MNHGTDLDDDFDSSQGHMFCPRCGERVSLVTSGPPPLPPKASPPPLPSPAPKTESPEWAKKVGQYFTPFGGVRLTADIYKAAAGAAERLSDALNTLPAAKVPLVTSNAEVIRPADIVCHQCGKKLGLFTKNYGPLLAEHTGEQQLPCCGECVKNTPIQCKQCGEVWAIKPSAKCTQCPKCSAEARFASQVQHRQDDFLKTQTATLAWIKLGGLFDQDKYTVSIEIVKDADNDRLTRFVVSGTSSTGRYRSMDIEFLYLKSEGIVIEPKKYVAKRDFGVSKWDNSSPVAIEVAVFNVSPQDVCRLQDFKAPLNVRVASHKHGNRDFDLIDPAVVETMKKMLALPI